MQGRDPHLTISLCISDHGLRISATDCGQMHHGSINYQRERHVRTGIWRDSLCVNNLDAMQKFYEEVMALPLMTRFPNAAFFKIADGYGGHSQVLALFDRSESPVIVGRTQKPPPLITSLSRFLSPISRAKREDWKRWGS